MSNKYKQPARYTEPLSEDELSGEEVQILIEINSLIRGISATIEADSSRAVDSDDPWGRIEPRLNNHILFINGHRGHGKTSLMLTLLQQWRRSWERAASGKGVDEGALAVRAEFRRDDNEVGAIVRFLDILDFDPMPNNMPLHAWLIGAWKTLAEAADSQQDHDPSCKSLEENLSCTERWSRLMQQALVAWSPTGSAHDNIISQALDRKEQIEDWQSMQQRWRSGWRSMVDAVLGALHGCSGKSHLPNDALVVVPIDDVDLQVERTAELLPALRLLHHPRVVYLLTGDLRLLEDMVCLDFSGRMARLAQAGSESVDTSWWARRLSSQAVRKTIPPSQQWDLNWVGLAEVLKQLSAPEDPEGKKSLASTLKELAEESREHGLPVKMMGYRKLQRLRERLKQSRPEMQEVELLTGLFEATVQQGRLPRETALPVRPDLNGTLLIRCHSESSRAVQARKIHIGASFAFAYRDHLGGETSHRRANNIALIEELFTREPSLVHPRGLIWEVGIALAWTEVFAGNLRGLFTWPMADHPSPFQLLRWSADWRQVRDVAPERESWRGDFLAYAWAMCQQRWQNKDAAPLTAADAEVWVKPFEAGKGLDSWDQLLNQFPTAPQSPTDSLWYWFRYELPRMATPEYGLSHKLQKAILTHAAGLEGWDNIRRTLLLSRRSGFGDALYRELEYKEPLREPVFSPEQEELLRAGIQQLAAQHGETAWESMVARWDPGAHLRGED